MARRTIELPIPMPTWNRILAMHPMVRKKLRDYIHVFVKAALMPQWPERIEFDGKLRDTDTLVAEYIAVIRPSKKNKLRRKEAKTNARNRLF